MFRHLTVLKHAVCMIALIASPIIAFAQSSPVFGVPQTEVPSGTQVPDNQPITLDQAIATFVDYSKAMQAEDREYVLAILAEPERSERIGQMQKIGESKFWSGVRYDGKSQVRCAACWDDKDEGPICVLDGRHYSANDPKKFSYGIYILKNIEGQSFIVDMDPPFKKKGKKYKKRSKKHDRICDREEWNFY